jgi:hypothetical protein
MVRLVSTAVRNLVNVLDAWVRVLGGLGFYNAVLFV